MANRVAVWSLTPAPPIFLVALQYWAIPVRPEEAEAWWWWTAGAVVVATIVWFGAAPRRFWWLAALISAVAACVFLIALAKLNIALRIAGGVPEVNLLELAAFFSVLAFPMAVVVGLIVGLLCSRRWIIRD